MVKKKCEVRGGAGRRKGPLCNLSPTQMEELCLPPIPKGHGGRWRPTREMGSLLSGDSPASSVLLKLG